jgi:phosphate transport system substrate-binding protein
VITNQSNPVSKLTVDEIGKIFRGEIRNWKEVGGNDGLITMYGRQSNSGTYVFFQEFILKGDYSPKMNHMNGTAQIVEAVKQDVSGIGYVGVGYIKDNPGVTVVKVAARAGAPYADPLNKSEVVSGVYPISRPLNQYIDGSSSIAVREFIEFELSANGQRIVEEEGFFTIPKDYKDFNQKAGF